MIYIVLNALPILVATALSLALAALWYRRRASAEMVVLGFVGQAWLAAILCGALILAPREAGLWVMTIGSAVVIWAGFVVPSVAVSHRWRGQSWATIASDLGYWLVAMVVQAVAMRLIGLVPPPAG